MLMVYSPGGGPTLFKWCPSVVHGHTLQWDGGPLGGPIAWPSVQEIRGGRVIGDCPSSDQDFTFSFVKALVEEAGELLPLHRSWP